MRRLLTAIVFVFIASIASAQTRSVFIEDMTSYEIRDAMAAGKTSAIIFAGGIEQNGPHMALVKHNLIARYVAGQIAERMGNALVFPIMPFSPAGDPVAKTGHMRFPGTVSISSEVFMGAMRQVAQSAAAAGFKNIFLMGDHGQGQSEMRVAAESVDADWRARGVRVYYVSDVNTKAGQQINAYLKEKNIVGGGHAAVAETSQVTATPWALALRTSSTLAALDSRQRWMRAPDSRARIRIVDSATVSAYTGTAGRPSRVATSPSCATPPRARLGSCARSQTQKPKVVAYSSARIRTWLSATAASA